MGKRMGARWRRWRTPSMVPSRGVIHGRHLQRAAYTPKFLAPSSTTPGAELHREQTSRWLPHTSTDAASDALQQCGMHRSCCFLFFVNFIHVNFGLILNLAMAFPKCFTKRSRVLIHESRGYSVGCGTTCRPHHICKLLFHSPNARIRTSAC